MTRLGVMLRLYRAVYGLSIRDTAEEIGIHYATLNRAERAEAGMTVDNFMKLVAWLLASAPAPRNVDAL